MAGRPQLTVAIAALTVIAAALALPWTVAAQVKYPERPVRIIVPFIAGGVADVTLRLVGEKLGAKLGQRFVVENVPGVSHLTIDKNEFIQQKVIAAIDAAVQSGPGGAPQASVSKRAAVARNRANYARSSYSRLYRVRPPCRRCTVPPRHAAR